MHSPVVCSPFGILKVGGITFAIGGTIVLGWIVMLLHSNIQELSNKLENCKIIYSLSSWACLTHSKVFLVPQGYDDEVVLSLKKSTKEISQNQSFLYLNLQNYSRLLEGFQQQMSTVSADVASIKDSLKEAPQMMNIGKELESLKSSLATYEATIMELKNSFTELKDPSFQLVNITGVINNMNSSVHGILDSVVQDLHHQHVSFQVVLLVYCFTFFFLQETLHSLKNKTEKLSADSSSALQRLDAAQTQLFKLESQQKNLTLTLDYAMDTLKELEVSRG